MVPDAFFVVLQCSLVRGAFGCRLGVDLKFLDSRKSGTLSVGICSC